MKLTDEDQSHLENLAVYYAVNAMPEHSEGAQKQKAKAMYEGMISDLSSVFIGLAIDSVHHHRAVAAPHSPQEMDTLLYIQNRWKIGPTKFPKPEAPAA